MVIFCFSSLCAWKKKIVCYGFINILWRLALCLGVYKGMAIIERMGRNKIFISLVLDVWKEMNGMEPCLGVEYKWIIL